jgi:hypothetical protein
VHSIRVREQVWQDAEAIARERDETLGHLIESYLKRYVARHRRHDGE